MPNSPESPATSGVSVVMPVHNGAAFLERSLQAVFAEVAGGSFEVIVVDDGSTDRSREVLEACARRWPFHLMRGRGKGMSAALNDGIRTARYPLVCQVDQDVILERGWLALLLEAFGDPAVAAAQGCYVAPPSASVWSRVMGLDLRDRYERIGERETDHVCTGNVVYRASALHQVGLFDEALGYGNDNDLSYRLRRAGYRLVLKRDARAVHFWRDSLAGYLSQQYGFGYGRLDVVARHPGRWTGDTVAPVWMMAHPPVMGAAIALAVAAAGSAAAGWDWRVPAAASAISVGVLVAERVVAAVRAYMVFRDPTALWFPLVHLARDLAWVAAVAVWLWRRLAGRPSRPAHSMSPRHRAAVLGRSVHALPTSPRILGVLPAHNESANLPAVIAGLRRAHPDIQLLVVDDGSTDGTAALLRELHVAWLRWPSRRGIGAAIRAGLVYASRLGFDIVVRIDADGQHDVDDIDALLRPIRDGRAEVVLGTRYAAPGPSRRRVVGLLQQGLAGCLTMVTGRRVTDPTSGFCAFGPRAIALLAEHHPDGYPEPELRLFLSRNGVTMTEVPVADRERLSGRTSLTWPRVLAAAVRVALAILVVPFRPTVTRARD